MCEDFIKNLKENKLTLLVCFINLVFCPFYFGYKNESDKSALLTLIEKILTFCITFLVVFKVRCHCKKKTEKAGKEEKKENRKKRKNKKKRRYRKKEDIDKTTIEEGNLLLNLLLKSPSLIERLKEMQIEGNSKAIELVNKIKDSGTNLLDII